MKEKKSLHAAIDKIICEGGEHYSSSEDITYKVLEKVQKVILPSMPGYIGDLTTEE